jgi:hypothetical protein
LSDHPLISAALFEVHDEWITLPRRQLPEGDMGDIYRKLSFSSSLLLNAPKCNRKLISNSVTRDNIWRMRVPDRVALASYPPVRVVEGHLPKDCGAFDLRVSW